ncbi:MAG: prenyltransferase, partial [Acidobacteriota bacterium]
MTAAVPPPPTPAAVFGVIRAPFLALPVTLVAAGAAAGAWEGAFSWSRTVVALVGLLALHAAVNAFNEVSDLRTGIDLATRRTPFSGGSGTLPEGRMTSRAALAVAVGATIAGAAIGAWFLNRVGWRLLPVLVLGAAAVLLYTDVLARSGMGECFAGLGLGGLPVWGSALVQGGDPGAASLAVSVPATFMTFNLLLLNEFPDEEADRSGGRRNLVLLLGRRAAAGAYAAAALATPASIAVAVVLGAL